MPERVRITDVSPRDGLQNEPGVIPTADKVRLIALLADTGVDEIELTSFVSPKWVPQLADATAVIAALAGVEPLAPDNRRCQLSVLVPNEKGMAEALKVDHDYLDKVSVFTAASETFSQRNTNATIDQTIERFRPVVAAAREHGLLVRAYISCVVACPFEGPIAPDRVARVAEQLLALGVDELDLGDTIGAGDARTIADMLRAVDRVAPLRAGPVPVTLHLHDTFARAAEGVRAALDLGVRSFDGSVAGLGGCPYAARKLPDGQTLRAPGNISTELLVRTVHEAGYATNVLPDALELAAAWARQIVKPR
jgi:hydroxymethylglutaryl-CoA lyase